MKLLFLFLLIVSITITYTISTEDFFKMIHLKNFILIGDFTSCKNFKIKKEHFYNEGIYKYNFRCFHFSTVKENAKQIEKENSFRQKKKKKIFKKIMFLTIFSSYGIYTGLNLYEHNEKMRKEIRNYPNISNVIENQLIPFKNCCNNYLKKGKEHIKLHVQNVESIEEFFLLLRAMFFKIYDNCKGCVSDFDVNKFLKQKKDKTNEMQSINNSEKESIYQKKDQTFYEYKKSKLDESPFDMLHQKTEKDKKKEKEGSNASNMYELFEMEKQKSIRKENKETSSGETKENSEPFYPIYFDEKQNLYRNRLEKQHISDVKKKEIVDTKRELEENLKELNRNMFENNENYENYENFQKYLEKIERDQIASYQSVPPYQSPHPIQGQCEIPFTSEKNDIIIKTTPMEEKQVKRSESISISQDKNAMEKVISDFENYGKTGEKMSYENEKNKIDPSTKTDHSKELSDREVFNTMLKNCDLNEFNTLLEKELELKERETVQQEKKGNYVKNPSNMDTDRNKFLRNSVDVAIGEENGDYNELISFHVKGFPCSNILKKHIKIFEEEIKKMSEKEVREKIVQLFINELINEKYRDVIVNEEKEMIKKMLSIQNNDLLLKEKEQLQKKLKTDMLEKLKEEKLLLKEKYEREKMDVEKNIMQLNKEEIAKEKQKIAKQVESIEEHYLKKMNIYASDINIIKEKYLNEENRKSSLEHINVILNQVLHLQNCLIHNISIEKILPELKKNLENDFFLNKIFKMLSSDFFSQKYKITNDHNKLKNEFYSLYKECVKEAFLENNSNFFHKQFNKMLSYLYIKYEKPVKCILMHSLDNTVLKKNLLNLSYASANIEANNLVEAIRYINQLEGNCRNTYFSFNERVKNMILFRFYLRLAISRLMLISKNMRTIQNE